MNQLSQNVDSFDSNFDKILQSQNAFIDQKKKNPVNSLIALSKLGQIATVIRIENTEIFFSLPFQSECCDLTEKVYLTYIVLR